MDDRSLRQSIIEELAWQPSIDSANIGVAVCEGVVNLTGQAPTYAEKILAESAAKRSRGVRAIAETVDDRIRVG